MPSRHVPTHSIYLKPPHQRGAERWLTHSPVSRSINGRLRPPRSPAVRALPTRSYLRTSARLRIQAGHRDIRRSSHAGAEPTFGRRSTIIVAGRYIASTTPGRNVPCAEVSRVVTPEPTPTTAGYSRSLAPWIPSDPQAQGREATSRRASSFVERTRARRLGGPRAGASGAAQATRARRRGAERVRATGISLPRLTHS